MKCEGNSNYVSKAIDTNWYFINHLYTGYIYTYMQVKHFEVISKLLITNCSVGVADLL